MLAKVVNDNAGSLTPRGALRFIAVGASLLAKVVNDNAGSLTPRSALRFIAVGASLLAKVVNDNAGSLTPRGVLRFIASKLAPTVGGGEAANPVNEKRSHAWLSPAGPIEIE
ncbi:hypothetical protein PS850_03466 [Pseudomonas fluorescens]|nr:hypothetical protein PS850_03466 [Pseudomonas fluorescens]